MILRLLIKCFGGDEVEEEEDSEEMGGEEILNVFRSLPFSTRLSSTNAGGVGGGTVLGAATAIFVC